MFWTHLFVFPRMCVMNQSRFEELLPIHKCVLALATDTQTHTYSALEKLAGILPHLISVSTASDEASCEGVSYIVMCHSTSSGAH